MEALHGGTTWGHYMGTLHGGHYMGGTTWGALHRDTSANQIKDGAYYRYCAYVLRISRHSGFLSVMLTNTGIFLRCLKLCGESIS